MTVETLLKLTEDSIARTEMYYSWTNASLKTKKELKERQDKATARREMLNLLKYWVENEDKLTINESELFKLRTERTDNND